MNAPSTERVRRLFEARIVPEVWPGRSLRALDRLRASLRPGRRCVASYAVSLDTTGPPAPEFVTLTWAPLERLRRIRRKCYGNRDERRPGGAFLLVDEGCLVEVFPADRKVPALREAMSLAELETEAGPSPVRGVRVLRYRAHRSAVLRYESSAGAAIGKVYRHASVATEVRDKLRLLAPQAAGRGLVIPRCLGAPRPEELVLMQRLEGDSMAERLETAAAGNGSGELVRRCARAIGAFRSMTLAGPVRRSLAGDVDSLARRSTRLGAGDRALVEVVEAITERLRECVAECEPGPPALVHGDFKPDQLLLAGDRVGIVDLDRACLGDAAIDAGNFVAALEGRESRLDRAARRALAETFLDEVDRESRDPRLARAARLYRVIALARRGVRALEGDLARGPGSGPERSGRKLLRRAGQLLTAWELR